MRILQIIAGMDIGGAHGGAERCGLELARGLAHQHSVELCAFWQRGTAVEQEWTARLQAEGIPYFFATPLGSARHPAAYLDGLRRILRRCPIGNGCFDIAHSHFQLGSLAAVLLRRKGAAKRALRTAHVTLEWGPGLANTLCRWVFDDWVFPLMLDGEAGVSQAVVDRLSRSPGISLIHRHPRLVYNAIPQENARSSVNPRSNLLVIGAVGRLTAQKDYPCLLDAFALLLQDMPDLKLMIVGDGEQRPFLEEKAKRLVDAGRVTFLGQRTDITALLDQMDLFVLPSLWEGLPTVVLECMAAGVPVIASDIPGTRELIIPGVTGWLFTPRQPRKLAETISYVLHHPLEIQRVIQAAASQIGQFSLSREVYEYQKLYQELLLKNS